MKINLFGGQVIGLDVFSFMELILYFFDIVLSGKNLIADFIRLIESNILFLCFFMDIFF